MSAINDALRRASSAAKASPQSSASPLPPMNVPPTPPWVAPVAPPPVPQPESMPQSREVTPPPIIASPLHDTSDERPVKKSSKLPLILIFGFLALVGGAAALYVFGTHHLIVNAREKLHAGNTPVAAHHRETAVADVNSKAAKPVDASAPGNHPATRPQPNVATVPAQPAPNPNPGPAVATPVAAPKPAATPNVPVRFPPLRLQSIFYRPGNASVMINSKTLFVGDEISGVAVADIQPSSVTLVLSGQTNILTLR